MLCIGETGDPKKGTTTDYTTRQYLGKLGKVELSVVLLNACGVLDTITFPLLFRIFKSERCLQPREAYLSKPQIALELIRELQRRGFHFQLVLADRLYGESGAFIAELRKLELHLVVALRDNHTVWLSLDHLGAEEWRRWRSVTTSEYLPLYVGSFSLQLT